MNNIEPIEENLELLKSMVSLREKKSIAVKKQRYESATRYRSYEKKLIELHGDDYELQAQTLIDLIERNSKLTDLLDE